MHMFIQIKNYQCIHNRYTLILLVFQVWNFLWNTLLNFIFAGKTYFFKNKYFWEFDDMRMRVAHEKPRLSSTFWMNCPPEVDTNDIDEIPPRRRTHLKVSSSSTSMISSFPLIMFALIVTFLSRTLAMRLAL